MSRKNRRGLFSIAIAIFFVLVLNSPAFAVEIRTGDFLTVPEGEIKGPLFVAGNNVTINSNVDGDVFCAGQNITVNGVINGDLLVVGQTIRVNGNITGDVRAAANQIDISREVQGSITGAGNSIALLQGSRVKRDVLLFGNTVQLFGSVDGQALGSAQQMIINGVINNDVKIWDIQNLSIGPTAAIGGNLSYRSSNLADISPQAKIASITREEKPVAPVQTRPEKRFSWWGALGWFAAGLLLWGATYLLFPKLLPEMGRVVRETPGQALGWGFLMLLVTPPAALILLITVIGIPLAIILVFVYVLLLFAAKILVGDVLGRYLSHYLGWEERVPVFVSFIAAFLALILLTKIPVIGFLVNLLVASLALGMVALSFYRWRNKGQEPEAETE